MQEISGIMLQLQEQIALATIAETEYDMPIMPEREIENLRQRLGALKKRHPKEFIQIDRNSPELKLKALNIIDIMYGNKPWE